MSRILSVLALLGYLVLAFADQAWLGRWQSLERKENWDVFLAALEVPYEPYGELSLTGAKIETVNHRLYKQGDTYHHEINVPLGNFTNTLDFKLGEEGTSMFNNNEFKYKYTEQGNDLFAEYNIPSKNKLIHDTYHVEGDTLTQAFKNVHAGITGTRWYKRMTPA